MLVEDSTSLAFHTAAVDDEKFLGLAAFEKKANHSFQGVEWSTADGNIKREAL